LVRLARDEDGDPVALQLSLSQVDSAAALGDDAFTLNVPDDFASVRASEIRRAGPLAQAR
jgi:hypothetical protein